MTVPYQFIRLEIADKIAQVSLNNPPGNSLNSRLLHELDRCMDELFINSEVKAILITGMGKSFCQGVDIEEISKITSAEEAREASEAGQKVFLKIENGQKPVIAAINGFCLGAGLELAMSCHCRIASDRAVMGMPEGNIGLIPSFGGTKRLPILVGRSHATFMILTGENVRAEQALSMGLVDWIARKELLVESSRKMAGKFACRSSEPMAQALRSIGAGMRLKAEESMEFEARCVERLYHQHDIKSDILAFLEKSKPDIIKH